MSNTSTEDLKAIGNPDIERFPNKDGYMLQSYAWTVPNPKGVVVCIHGVTSHVTFEFMNHNYSADDAVLHANSFAEGIVKDAEQSVVKSIMGAESGPSVTAAGSGEEDGEDTMPGTTPSASEEPIDKLPTPAESEQTEEFRKRLASDKAVDSSQPSQTPPLTQPSSAPLSPRQSIEKKERFTPQTSRLVAKLSEGRSITYSGSFIERFNKAGFTVLAYDQQAHGESEGWLGIRCNAKAFDDFCFDALQFLLRVQSKYIKPACKEEGSQNPLPLFLLGISMGGGVVCRTIQLWRLIRRTGFVPKPGSRAFLGQISAKSTSKPETPRTPVTLPAEEQITVQNCQSLSIRGLIVLCPNLRIRHTGKAFVFKTLSAIASGLAALTPHAKMGGLTKNPMYPWIQTDRTDDPLMYDERIPARMVEHNLKAGIFIFRDLPLLYDNDEGGLEGDNGDKKENKSSAKEEFSIVVAHSKDDGICDCEMSKKFCESLKEHVSDISLIHPESMFHYLTCEPGCEALGDELVKWVGERVHSSKL